MRPVGGMTHVALGRDSVNVCQMKTQMHSLGHSRVTAGLMALGGLAGLSLPHMLAWPQDEDSPGTGNPGPSRRSRREADESFSRVGAPVRSSRLAPE